MKNNIELIKLKDLLYRHARFTKEKKEYFYEVIDVSICDIIVRSDNNKIYNKDNKFSDFGVTITKKTTLKLRVIHEYNNINFEFGFIHELIERQELESLKNNRDILEDFFIQLKKIGKITKTKYGFNLKLDLIKSFRYKANVFCYIKVDNTHDLYDIKEKMLLSGFEEKEIVYDIKDYINFSSMYERSLKEGDLIVIPELSMIKNDLEGIRQIFLYFIKKGISFCIDDYMFLYDVYKEYSKEEVLDEMINFFSFYIEKKEHKVLLNR